MPDGLGNIAKIVGIGGAGAGLIGNIMNSITRGKAIGKLEGYEKLTPEQLAGKVAAATKSLDQALVENVQNQVQADVASRGLAQAPGVFAAEESQALAPAEQQNQNTALQLILRQLGIPEDILASTQGSSDPMGALLMLMLANQNKTAPTPNQVPGTPEGGDDVSQIIADILSSQVPNPSTSSPDFGGAIAD